MNSTDGGGAYVSRTRTVGGDLESADCVGDEIPVGVVDGEGVSLVVADTDRNRIEDELAPAVGCWGDGNRAGVGDIAD